MLVVSLLLSNTYNVPIGGVGLREIFWRTGDGDLLLRWYGNGDLDLNIREAVNSFNIQSKSIIIYFYTNTENLVIMILKY